MRNRTTPGKLLSAIPDCAGLVTRLCAAVWHLQTNFCPQIASFAGSVHYLSRTAWTFGLKPVQLMLETIKYLRDVAQTCTRLARGCPDIATAHGLEEIAVSLMAKAHELESHFER
ncbi:MAG: hypothetical protein KGK33_17500 [Hyphomicrobiales bacterium]|nr:hypothetical protein [Hyphomicrobiales bacterium]